MQMTAPAINDKVYQRQMDQELKQLLRMMRGITRNEVRLIKRAFEFAKEAHRGVRRKSGEPYILHPLAVATIVVQEMGLIDVTAVIAAFLHDVVEDTDVELDEIRRAYGSTVMEIVNGLTKISGSEAQTEIVSAQAETFRKVLLTISDDVRVVLIKIADRLHNMRTLGAMKHHKMLKVSSETLYIYAPLAHRLGLYKVKTELEDLAFKYSQPQSYEEIAQKLAASKIDAEAYIASFIEATKKAMKVTGLRYRVKSRYKSIYSIYAKMQRKQLPFEEVYDLYAIRIILDTRAGKERDDCWRVYSVLSGKYRPNPKRLRDWITVPKGNGYESLHTTLLGPDGNWIEVQIRTTRMDEIAEKGIAAHWKYKGDDKDDKFLTEWVGQIREILANPSLSALEALQKFKENLQPNDVFVFTPKGEMMRMPRHSTVLDFAYRIHTGLGDTAIGGKVNHRVVELDHELRPGDQVEVLTSRKGQPKEEWLRFVQTPKAKDQIRSALRRQRRNLVEAGKQMFEWRAQYYGISEDHPVMKELLAYFMMATPDDFYHALGAHKIELGRLLEFIKLKKEGRELSEDQFKDWETRRKVMAARLEEFGVKEDMLVLGKEQEIGKYILGKCCKPIPGDDILGFAEKEKITIHRTGCPKAISLMSQFGGKIIQANWTTREGHSDVTFLVAIRIVGHDKQGMLSDLVRIISKRMNLNIRKLNIESYQSMFEGIFHLYIRSQDELTFLLEKIKNVPNVYDATRYEVHEDE